MAQSHLEQGVQHFVAVKDDVNLALLYSNTGRLMRLLAHYHSSTEGYPLTKTEKYYYSKVYVLYLQTKILINCYLFSIIVSFLTFNRSFCIICLLEKNSDYNLIWSFYLLYHYNNFFKE